MPESTPPRTEMLASRFIVVLRNPALYLLLIALLSFGVYGRVLNRYFVSDDFYILRFLSQGSYWENAWALLTGPAGWPSTARWYRPISTLILQTEFVLFGTWSTGYMVSHLLVHLANVLMVWGIARRLMDRDTVLPIGAALIFAVYPLHPNTVAFVGGFATLFSTTACLAALLLLLRHRYDGRRRHLVGSWICFALALACYEGAVVLPVMLVSAELVSSSWSDARSSWRPLVMRHLPYGGLVVAYVVLRAAMIDTWVGGYGGLSPGLTRVDGGTPSAFLWLNWARLLQPTYDVPQPAGLQATANFAVVVAMIIFGAKLRAGRRAPRLGLMALVWIIAAQAPFTLYDLLPPDGRYWYLASVGVGLLIPATARTLAPLRFGSIAVTGASLAIAGYYFVILHQHLESYAQAGATAKALQSQLLESTPAPPPRRVFLRDRPEYEYNASRVRIAQVLNVGLADALRAPFVERELAVYPLRRLSWEQLLPLFDRPDLGVVRSWNGTRVEPAQRPAVVSLGSITVTASPMRGSKGLGIRFKATDAAHYRLIVLTPGGSRTVWIPSKAGAAEFINTQLPAKIIRPIQDFYGGEVFWWIEALDSHQRPTAMSELQVLPAPRARF